MNDREALIDVFSKYVSAGEQALVEYFKKDNMYLKHKTEIITTSENYETYLKMRNNSRLVVPISGRLKENGNGNTFTIVAITEISTIFVYDEEALLPVKDKLREVRVNAYNDSGFKLTGLSTVFAYQPEGMSSRIEAPKEICVQCYTAQLKE